MIPDDRLISLQADVIQAIGQPIRLAIVYLLADGELCVCDIAERVGAERSNVSRHLSQLLKAGVLDVRKDGLKMIYSLRTPCVLRFLSCITDVVHEKLSADVAVLKDLAQR